MENQIQYTPRIVRGMVELWVPHEGGEIAFAHPKQGPGNYQNVGAEILGKGQLVPIGNYTASLLHVAYCNSDTENEPEFRDKTLIVPRKVV